MLSKRTFTIFLSLSLVVGLALLVIVSNRDRTQVLYERLDPNTIVTSDLPNLLYTNSLQQNPHANFFSFFEKSGTFECLNGKDPSKLSQKEQLLEFIQGPCLPVIAVPGLLGSRLSVRIDCETFQAQNPEIFKACGWDTCSWWQVWGSKPNDEYVLWISDFIGPLSIIFDSTVRCWGNIIQLEYNTSEPDITKKYRSPIGANVTVYREKETSNSKCGFEAVNNIIPGPYQTLYSKGYDGIHKSLVNMGYQPGLTLFAAPYDWRKTTMANGITDVLNQTVRQNYALTGKPTIIMAHSLGNFGTLHLLNSLSTEEKEKYIANFVSITNPLAGSPKAVKTFVGGDKDYVYKKFGVNFYAQKKLISDSSGAFDVLPKDPYRLFANSTWLQEWKARAVLENSYDVKTKEGRQIWENTVAKGNYTYKWFPHPLLNCSYGFEQRRDECGLYMYNWSEIPIATVMNKTYTADEDDLNAFFDEYALATNVSDQLFDDTRTNFIYKLKNPEVPVTLIYGSHLSTEMSYEWDYDPRINARKGEFAFPNVTLYTQGDQTVPTSSALLPALKWSWEFDNKEKSGVTNAKPIKTVEICSTHNNKGNIYDNKPENSSYSILHNEYIGLDCDCFNQKNDHPVLGQSCDHGDILNDSKLIKFITELVNANHRISNTSNLIVHQINDQDLKLISQTCPHVNANVTIFDQILKNMTSQAHLRPGIHKFVTD